MNTFEITVRHRTGETWPVVAEWVVSGELPVRDEADLQLDPDSLRGLDVAHGRSSTEDAEQALLLERPRDGKTDPVEASQLIERLSRARGLLHLIFLSCCQSADPAEDDVVGPLSRRLVRVLGVPAVVGMAGRVQSMASFVSMYRSMGVFTREEATPSVQQYMTFPPHDSSALMATILQESVSAKGVASRAPSASALLSVL
jgi:hypothetical protein